MKIKKYISNLIPEQFKLWYNRKLYAIKMAYAEYKFYAQNQQDLIVEHLRKCPFVPDNSIRENFYLNLDRRIQKERIAMAEEGIDYDEFVKNMNGENHENK